MQEYGNEIMSYYFDSGLQQPLSITFQVTDNCNLQCSYCYQTSKSNHSMPLNIAKKFIDDILFTDNEYIKSQYHLGCILDFIGGEPFLEIELIDQIINYFTHQVIKLNHPWQYNWRISLCSNGVLYFTPKVQQFLKKYKNKISLNITIDGNKQLHDSCRVFPNGNGSYDLAVSAMQHYVKNYSPIPESKMTLAPKNIQYTYDAVINLINLGYNNINLNCVFEKGWNYSHATILYNELKKVADYLLQNNLENKITLSILNEILFRPKSLKDKDNWCGGNGKMIAVDWKGDIFPCLRYMESSLGSEVPPYIIGNVFEGIYSTEKQRKMGEDLKKVNRITQSTDECINCSIAEGCAWCQAYNYQDGKGNINHRATYICVMHKARALANCYYWNMKYWKNKELKRMKLWLSDEEALKIISKDELEFLKALQYPINENKGEY